MMRAEERQLEAEGIPQEQWDALMADAEAERAAADAATPDGEA